MLKIKDYINLKVLEKYDFSLIGYEYYHTCNYYWTIKVNTVNNEICFVSNEEYDDYLPDVIFDMINNGLVEEVKE